MTGEARPGTVTGRTGMPAGAPVLAVTGLSSDRYAGVDFEVGAGELDDLCGCDFAAAVIGGVSLTGGRGTVFGAIILVALTLSRIISGRKQE